MGEVSEQAVPALLPLLADSDPLVRYASAFALGQADADNCLVPSSLVKLLRDEVPEVRGMAACALGELGSPGLIGLFPLLELLKDQDQTVRTWAEAAISTLLEFVKDPSVVVGRLECLLFESDLHSRQAVIRLLELTVRSYFREVQGIGGQPFHTNRVVDPRVPGAAFAPPSKATTAHESAHAPR